MIDRKQINKTQEIDLDEFVRRLKAYQNLFKPEPSYEELDHKYYEDINKEEEVDAYS